MDVRWQGDEDPCHGRVSPDWIIAPLSHRIVAATNSQINAVAANYNSVGTNKNDAYSYDLKGDHIFNDRHRISGYYAHDREHQTPGPDGPATLPGLYTNYNDLVQASDVLRFSWDWTFSPTKLNHFYAGGNNWAQDHKPPQEYIGNWQSKFCLGNVPNCNENLVNLFSGGTSNPYSTWGGQADNGSENTVYAYNDDFTWVRDKHTVKIGGMWQINHYNGFGRQCEAGCVGFSYTETGKAGITDPKERMQVLQDAEKIFLDDLPLIPLLYYKTKHMVSKRVAGWTYNNLDFHLGRYMSVN